MFISLLYEDYWSYYAPHSSLDKGSVPTSVHQKHIKKLDTINRSHSCKTLSSLQGLHFTSSAMYEAGPEKEASKTPGTT